MGASQNPTDPPIPAAVMSSVSPEVRIERADEADDGETRVFVEGTMFHDGLNKNAWGLTEAGAEAIASDLEGRDHIAHHPLIRNGRYDRSLTDGPGFPIGKVRSTGVERIDEAMVDGGEYTATYVSEVLDPVYKARYASGQYDGGDYSVSIGIYGDPESAECSVCGHAMAGDDCEHERFDEVVIESDDGDDETLIAGPLYDDGQADHLASVYMPAYEGAEANVTTASVQPSGGRSDGGAAAVASGGGLAGRQDGGDVPLAASVLAAPFDGTPADEPETATETETETAPSEQTPDDAADGFRVRLDDEAASSDESGSRSSFRVRFDHG